MQRYNFKYAIALFILSSAARQAPDLAEAMENLLVLMKKLRMKKQGQAATIQGSGLASDRNQETLNA
jgi:hypothetical protein